jgi:hypothetical protein
VTRNEGIQNQSQYYVLTPIIMASDADQYTILISRSVLVHDHLSEPRTFIKFSTISLKFMTTMVQFGQLPDYIIGGWSRSVPQLTESSRHPHT